MTPADDGLTAEDWLSQLYEPDDVPDDELNAPMLRWLRRYFDARRARRRGTSSKTPCWRINSRLAEEAAAAALHDLEHATSLRHRVCPSRITTELASAS